MIRGDAMEERKKNIIAANAVTSRLLKESGTSVIISSASLAIASALSNLGNISPSPSRNQFSLTPRQ